jgi:hypothetical protein
MGCKADVFFVRLRHLKDGVPQAGQVTGSSRQLVIFDQYWKLLKKVHHGYNQKLAKTDACFQMASLNSTHQVW